MIIAVTGATGFLGRYIVNHLLAAGHRCRCWYRPESNRAGFLNDGQNIDWLPGTLNNPQATEALTQGADAVVHAALERHGGWNPQDSDILSFVETNILGSLRLIESARRHNVPRFIFISTCAVHDVILPDRKLDETHPLWPLSHYGAHKAAIEKFVHSFGLPRGQPPQGWPICSLRPTGIYGLATPPTQSRWLGVIRDVLADKPIETPSGGKEVHAADVAKAVEVLLNAPPQTIAGQAYNCYDLYVAMQHVAQIAKNLSASKSPIANLNRGPKNQIDTSKLQALGMTFGGRLLLEQTVAELVHAAKSF